MLDLKRRSTIALLQLGGIIALAVLPTPPADGQQPPPAADTTGWVGKRIILQFGSVLKVGNQVVDNQQLKASVSGGLKQTSRIYRVERVNGPWLWLKAEGEGTAGWIRATEVVLYDQAIDYFTNQIRSNPASEQAYTARAHIWKDKGEFDIALADYNEAVRLDANSEVTWNNRGNAWASKAEYDKAISDYDQAIRIDPRYSTAYCNRGLAWRNKKDLDRAIADYTLAISNDPTDSKYYRVRGIAWHDKAEYGKAIADYSEAIRLDPKGSEAYRARGRSWRSQKEYDRAILDYTEAIRFEPKSATAFDDRGSALYDKSDYDKAITDYTESIRLDGKYVYAYLNRGIAWLVKKEYSKAVDDFNEAIRIDHKIDSAFGRRGDAWHEKSEYERAIADYSEAIRLNPKSPEWCMDRGNTWLAKKEYAKAIADFSEAIRLDPTSARAHDLRGDSWFAKGDPINAIADYTEAIKIDPKFAVAYCDRGRVLDQQRDYDKAIADYSEAVRLEPKYTMAYYLRGSAWLNKKNYDRAIADNEDAIRISPKFARAHFGKAVAELIARRGNPIQGFKTALELEKPRGEIASYAVIMGEIAARRAGRLDDAKDFLSVGAADLAHDAWPYPAVNYLAGKLDEAGLLALAVDVDKQTEVRCFLGLDLALKNRSDEAKAHYRWVKEHGNPEYIEYAIAVAELDRLEGGVGSPTPPTPIPVERPKPAATPNPAASAKFLGTVLYLPTPDLEARVGTDPKPLADYVDALKARLDAIITEAEPSTAKGLLVGVGIKAGRRSKVWCQAVEGDIPAPLLRTIERELGDIPAVDLKKAPAGFGLKFGLHGNAPSAWPEVPDRWRDASLSTRSKVVIPPDDLFKILWPD